MTAERAHIVEHLIHEADVSLVVEALVQTGTFKEHKL